MTLQKEYVIVDPFIVPVLTTRNMLAGSSHFAAEKLNDVATVFPGVNWICEGNLGGASNCLFLI